MSVLENSEESPALGTSVNLPKKVSEWPKWSCQAGRCLLVSPSSFTNLGRWLLEAKLTVANLGMLHASGTRLSANAAEPHRQRGQLVLWMKPPSGKGNNIKLRGGRRPDRCSDTTMTDTVWDPAQNMVEEMQAAWTPGVAWDTRAPLTPGSSDLAADVNGFLGNTNPPPVPLGCSLGVTQSSRNTYFLLSRISAILTEYNLLSPMLNQGNKFPIFNSACNTLILLQSFWNPNRKNRR